jgi:CheY-like chemotaxis protein
MDLPFTGYQMKNFSAFEARTAGAVVALSVFPKQEDHASLRSIFRSSDWPLCPGLKWDLETTRSLDEALPILRNGRIPVVLCERDLHPGTWKDMVEALAQLPDPPYLIVTSKQADERLWVEALNLGAYDVLQTPFNAAEVTRALGMAWLRWIDRRQSFQAKVARSVA